MANEARRAPIGRSLTILGVAATAYALAQTSVVPAVGEIAVSLHASQQSVAWTLTSYLVSAAVLTPVIGRLGDMFGKRRLLVTSLVLFACGAALAAVSNSVALIVGGRVLQGAGGGIFPLCFGIIRDEFPEARRPSAIGLMSAIAGIGGGVGLLVGGLLVDHASYRWIFWSGTAMAMAAAISAQLLLPESPTREPGRIDLIGTLLLATGVTAPLIAVSQASAWGWGSARFIGLVSAGLLLLAIFATVERRTSEPLVDMTIFTLRPVLITNVTTLLVGFGMFGVFLLVPQLTETPKASGYGFGGDATLSGLLMLPGSLTMMLFGPLSGRLASRFGGKTPLVLGGLITAVGMLLLAVAHGSPGSVLGLTMVVFAGVGLAFAAMPNLIVDSVPASKTGEATGVNALVRSVGSSLGAQLIASILAGSVTRSVGLPTERAFQFSFLLGAAGALLATMVALAIPSTRGEQLTVRSHEVEPQCPAGQSVVSKDED